MWPFPRLAAKGFQVHWACGVIVLQSQLALGIRPRASTRIRHAVGSNDLARHTAAPLGATRLIGQGLSDKGKGRPLGPGFLDRSVSQR